MPELNGLLYLQPTGALYSNPSLARQFAAIRAQRGVVPAFTPAPFDVERFASQLHPDAILKSLEPFQIWGQDRMTELLNHMVSDIPIEQRRTSEGGVWEDHWKDYLQRQMWKDIYRRQDELQQPQKGYFGGVRG